MTEARDDWYLQATIGLQGCISPDLNRHAATEEHCKHLVAFSKKALQRLLARDQSRDLSVPSWNGFGLLDTTLNAFLSDLPEVGHVNLFKTARQFIALLRGEFTSRVSDVEATSWLDQ